MFKKYRLTHRKHTGKLVHHRHTHYPALFVLMLIAGLLIFVTDRVAQADDLLVAASVPAPIPAGAPTFSSPAEGSTVGSPSVQFVGTCPVISPAIIVALYEGPSLLGSGTCHADGTFTIATTLQKEGAHTIIATVYTITHGTGQSSTPLHITYRAPVSSTPLPSSTSSSTSPAVTRPHDSGTSAAPLDIVVEQPYLIYSHNTPGEWRGQIRGGISPYQLTVDWGDGHKDIYTVNNNDVQVFSHAYSGNLDHTFKVTVQDTNGSLLTREFAVRYVGPPGNTRPNSGTITSLLDGPPQDSFVTGISIYLCLLVTMLMMWRYEHKHYPRTVLGVPLHYPWQKRGERSKPRQP